MLVVVGEKCEELPRFQQVLHNPVKMIKFTGFFMLQAQGNVLGSE